MQEKVFPRPERHMSVSFRAKCPADALFAVEFLDQIYVGAKISLGALFGGVAGAAEQRRKHNARRQCRAIADVHQHEHQQHPLSVIRREKRLKQHDRQQNIADYIFEARVLFVVENALCRADAAEDNHHEHRQNLCENLRNHM